MLIHIINHKGSQESVAICSLDSNIYMIPPPPRNPIWKQNKEMKTVKLMLRLHPLVNPFLGVVRISKTLHQVVGYELHCGQRFNFSS